MIECLNKKSFVERSSVEKEDENDVDGVTSHDEVRLNAYSTDVAKIMYPDPESRPLTFVPSVPLLNVFDGPLSLSVYAVRLELSCFINF